MDARLIPDRLLVKAPLAPELPSLEGLDGEAAQHVRRALSSSGKQDWHAAIDAFEEAIAAAPDARLYLHLGAACLRAGELEGAGDALELAAFHDPGSALARYFLGAKAYACKEAGNAREHFQAALRIDPALAPAAADLGVLLFEAGDFTAARALLEELVRRHPDAASYHNRLGLVILRGEGMIEPARRQFEAALRASGLRSRDAWVNLAFALRCAGRLDEALAIYERILEIAPDDYVRWQRGLTLLLKGDFAHAWPDYELRWGLVKGPPRRSAMPLWHGESLQGRTLLVTGEQGPGDQILFASCLPDLLAEAQAARALRLECHPGLVGLFRQSFSGFEVSAAAPAPDRVSADCQVALGSLPLRYRRAASSFSDGRAFLRADPERLAACRRRLDGLDARLRVGISWRGGGPLTNGRIRSTALEAWLPILGTRGCEFICLQYGDVDSDLAQVKASRGVTVHHWPDTQADLEHTAALVAGLDLVISVCTTIVHVAGGLGVPTWVLVPAIPEWAFLAEGERIPWYGSVRLLRQDAVGDWSAVFAEVNHRLRALLASQ